MLSVGSVFNEHYCVCRCIGSGGMGAVYEVLDTRTDRRRALKVMLPRLLEDPDAQRRFALEATVAADVSSEHIVEVTDAGIDTATSCPFIVMELLRGLDLAQLLNRSGPLATHAALDVLEQLARALDKTHSRRIVHRDLKPENLFLSLGDGGDVRLKVLDFGIAKLAARSTQSAHTTLGLGTPVYMSPEQLRGDGKIDARSDLYSLGQVAYTMLVGRPYFEEREDEHVYSMLLRIATGTQFSASVVARAAGVELSQQFDAWFARATARDPADRFGSARAMVEELGRFLTLDGSVETPRAAAWADVRDLLQQASDRVTPLPERRVTPGNMAGPLPRGRTKRSAPTLVAAAGGVALLALGAWFAVKDIGVLGGRPITGALQAAAFGSDPAVDDGAREPDGTIGGADESAQPSNGAADLRASTSMESTDSLDADARQAGAPMAESSTPRSASAPAASRGSTSGGASIAHGRPPPSPKVGHERNGPAEASKDGIVSEGNDEIGSVLDESRAGGDAAGENDVTNGQPVADADLASRRAKSAAGSLECVPPYYVDRSGIKRFRPECVFDGKN